MGKLVKLVYAKRQKIINTLISEKIYQPDDQNYLNNLPLKDLEELLKCREKSI
ncbi:hypothetical protein [Bacillus sp. CECT 9360]|uniref:hypothetical protein n=1 Tax=Bacillus sp. CECT 9360 TaxID=2845821 RepID=UPI001E58BDEF|nr:hypothetical protein [Bacillus sp. CECT 9360]CAH0345278.1 hypothetical protein BCI9360_01560 [Bacillus sp. CECT 9360]